VVEHPLLALEQQNLVVGTAEILVGTYRHLVVVVRQVKTVRGIMPLPRHPQPLVLAERVITDLEERQEHQEHLLELAGTVQNMTLPTVAVAVAVVPYLLHLQRVVMVGCMALVAVELLEVVHRYKQAELPNRVLLLSHMRLVRQKIYI
jgi:hypothetical protein